MARLIYSGAPACRLRCRGDSLASARTRQAQMFTQGASFIVAPENATLLQDRHDAVGKILQAARQRIRHQVETVSGAALEPMFDIVGDLFGRADHDAVP